MQNRIGKIIKATIISIVVALLIAVIIAGAIMLCAGEEIGEAITLINTMSVRVADNNYEKLTYSKENNRLENYPAYGTKYGDMTIESIGVNLPIYLGDTLEILRKGVGHFSGSYFPGEGGSIIYAAHNTAKFLQKLPNVKVGDMINVKTDYGEFNYQIYETAIIKETDEDKLPIQDNREILMIYTCYPTNGISHKTQRFVAYAELV